MANRVSIASYVLGTAKSIEFWLTLHPTVIFNVPSDMESKLVFISGLHRSGTSILSRVVSSAPDATGFSNTGVPEDEGQHLQSVYKPAKYFGGPGKFAFDKQSYLDEDSNLVSEENRKKLLRQWRKHWNTDKKIWVEKSPPNITKQRFLQALFPEAYFITVYRHPVAVALATRKWSKSSLKSLIHHWLLVHESYVKNRPALKRELNFSYEYMVGHTDKVINGISDLLETEIRYKGDFSNKNSKYFNHWQNFRLLDIEKTLKKKKIINKYENRLRRFGYSLVDLKKHPYQNINLK